MSYDKHFEALLRLYLSVLGREPVGRQNDQNALRHALDRLEQPVREMNLGSYPQFGFPTALLEYWTRYGGETTALSKYFVISCPETIIAGLGHIVFANDQRAGELFGIDHYMMEDDDPYVYSVATEKASDVFAWEEFSPSLAMTLTQFTARNIAESLLGTVVVNSCRDESYLEAVDKMEHLPMVRGHNDQMLIHYARGLVVCEEPKANTALIGYVSAESIQNLLARYTLSILGGTPVFED